MRAILVTEPFSDRHIAQIKEAAGSEFAVKQLPLDCEESELKDALENAEIVVGQPAMKYIAVPESDCPKLKFIQMTWAGTDQYTRGDIPFPKDRIRLSNGSGTYGMIMSQYVIGQILALMQNFKGYMEQQQKEIWQRLGKIKSLDKAKVLIFGAGDIGSAVAGRLQGFSAYTIGVCRNKDKYRPYFDKLVNLEEAGDYLGKVDVVVGCIPNSEQTAGYFDASKLSKLKQDCIIVNVGRGNFIDCLALDEELRSGHLWGAALDVTNPEPLPENHPLWSNPRCIITPHTSGTTFGQLEATEDLICGIVCENIRRYLRDEELKNVIF